MKTIGYVRGSTDKQKITIEMQIEKIKAYCNIKDLNLVDMIIDPGETAKNLRRPGIQRLLDIVNQKKIGNCEIEAVVIYKIDRMFRNTEEALQIAKLFQEKEIAFHSICESIDTHSPWGKFFYTLISAFAELERNMISERTKIALQHQKNNNMVYGTIPYGWKRDCFGKDGCRGKEGCKGIDRCPIKDKYDGKIIKYEKEQIIVRFIESFSLGFNYNKIAKYLNECNLTTRNGGKWYAQQIKNILNKMEDNND